MMNFRGKNLAFATNYALLRYIPLQVDVLLVGTNI